MKSSELFSISEKDEDNVVMIDRLSGTAEIIKLRKDH